MKKHTLLLILGIINFLSFSCTANPPIDPPVTLIKETATETIRDLAFTTGFSLTPKLPSDMAKVGYVDTLYFKSITGNPLWHLAQWNTNVDLKGAALQKAADGSLYFGNIAKKIALYPDSSLVLELNASAEYAHPRLDGEPWVHLLIEQSFSFAPFVNTAKRIDFSAQLMLLKCDNKMSPGTFNQGLHTAQSPMYFVVRGKGNDGYIWFGIPSFDYRDVTLSDKSGTMWDEGTQTYIANLAPSGVWGSTKFKVNEWRSGKIDLKPQIIAAFNAVKALGKFPNTTVDDLKITGMNFGWEIPGTFDAAIKIKKLSLKIVK